MRPLLCEVFLSTVEALTDLEKGGEMGYLHLLTVRSLIFCPQFMFTGATRIMYISHSFRNDIYM